MQTVSVVAVHAADTTEPAPQAVQAAQGSMPEAEKVSPPTHDGIWTQAAELADQLKPDVHRHCVWPVAEEFEL